MKIRSGAIDKPDLLLKAQRLVFVPSGTAMDKPPLDDKLKSIIQHRETIEEMLCSTLYTRK